jgi:hypothetical protein
MADCYVIDPLAPFPARWRDKLGPIRVMSGPVQGYVMVRRPGAFPFVLSVKQLLNAEHHPVHGPFEVVGVQLQMIGHSAQEPR